MKLLSLLLVSAAHLALAQASAQGNGFGLSNMVQRTSYVTPETPPAAGGQSTTTGNGGSFGQTPATTAPATPAPTTSQCSDACGALYQPVCGSDGKTYSNECTLSVASCKNPELKLAVKSLGVCAQDSGAAQGTPPPSGGDSASPSTSPGSSGSVTPAPITTAPVTSTCKQTCSKIRKPVCGSDGTMYSNLCILKNAQCDNPEIVQMAEDKCSSTTTSTSGSSSSTSTTTGDSSTSTSTSIGGSKGPVISTGGSDSNMAQCTTMCTMELDPVCGSDGKTYSNPCALKNAQCENPKSNIVVKAAGECQVTTSPSGPGSTVNQGSTTGGTDSTSSTSNCPSMCTADYNPVCGSDGKTYSNKCQLSIAKCKNPTNNISLKSEGECVTKTASPGSPIGGSSSTTTGSSTTNTITSDSGTSTSGNTDTKGYSTGTSGNSVTTGSSTTSTGSTTTTGSSTSTSGTTGTTASSTSGNAATGTKQPVPTEPIKAAPSKCEMACTKQYAPVCGSNGKTYTNSCALKLANCKSSKKEITIRSEGACVKPSISTSQKTSGATSKSTSTTTTTSGSATPASETGSSPASGSTTTVTTSKGSGTTTSTTTGTTGNISNTGASATVGGKGTYLRGPVSGNSPVQGNY